MNPELASYNLDSLAWKATCEWHSKFTGRNFSFDADYIELTRWFLWDKVGRAIRISAGSRSTQLERELIETTNCSSSTRSSEANLYGHYLRPYLNWVKGLIKKKTVCYASQTHDFQRSPGPLVYVPILSDRLINAVGELIQRNICQVIVGYSQGPLEGAGVFEPISEAQPDISAAASVYKAIIKGLEGFGVSLLAGDAQTLQSQVLHLTTQVKSVQAELGILMPDAILVHGDNHPPFQAYVLAANKLGIPSIMLQHGLDCEHRYLDEAYASAIAVWGPERAHRYRERSTRQPNISVTGNPEYDHLRTPVKIDSSGDYWLWVTRPHTTEKCYAPSRTPEEGTCILYSLIEALQKVPRARLVIRPHPYDYRDHYAQIIIDQGMQARVDLSLLNVHDLFRHASLVITEDSSAGLDAMFAGKPLIHAHFADNKPTMPFVDYGAAFPGFSSGQLMESVLRAGALDDNEAQFFLRGQVDFIKDFAGLCDGRSAMRFVDFIEEILCQK